MRFSITFVENGRTGGPKSLFELNEFLNIMEIIKQNFKSRPLDINESFGIVITRKE